MSEYLKQMARLSGLNSGPQNRDHSLERLNGASFATKLCEEVIKERISAWDQPGLGWALNSMVSILMRQKRRKQRHPGVKAMCTRHRDHSYASRSQKAPTKARSIRNWKRQGRILSQNLLRWTWPSWHLELRLPASRTVRETCCCLVTQLVVIC